VSSNSNRRRAPPQAPVIQSVSVSSNSNRRRAPPQAPVIQSVSVSNNSNRRRAPPQAPVIQGVSVSSDIYCLLEFVRCVSRLSPVTDTTPPDE